MLVCAIFGGVPQTPGSWDASYARARDALQSFVHATRLRAQHVVSTQCTPATHATSDGGQALHAQLVCILDVGEQLAAWCQHPDSAMAMATGDFYRWLPNGRLPTPPPPADDPPPPRPYYAQRTLWG